MGSKLRHSNIDALEVVAHVLEEIVYFLWQAWLNLQIIGRANSTSQEVANRFKFTLLAFLLGNTRWTVLSGFFLMVYSRKAWWSQARSGGLATTIEGRVCTWLRFLIENAL